MVNWSVGLTLYVDPLELYGFAWLTLPIQVREELEADPDFFKPFAAPNPASA